MTPAEEETIKSESETLLEKVRLRTLSDKDLVREIRSFKSYDDCDLHVEEMMNRLWEGWTAEQS